MADKEVGAVYKDIINGDPDTAWAIFITAGGSALKVQATGVSLDDLSEEFDDGRIQFAFVRVTDSETNLRKFVLINWCGEGVPDRVKGFFGVFQPTVAKILNGYHVSLTARNQDDVTPQAILSKIQGASGSRYSSVSGPSHSGLKSQNTAGSSASRGAFSPPRASAAAHSTGGSSSRFRHGSLGGDDDADDGWGGHKPSGASELSKVESAYKPIGQVDISALRQQEKEKNSSIDASSSSAGGGGGYQPVGKVDIAAIRAKASANGQDKFSDRPEPIRGSYTPVGKPDIDSLKSQVSGSAKATEHQDASSELSFKERMKLFSNQNASNSEPPAPKRFGNGAATANKFGGAASSISPVPQKPSHVIGGASKNFASSQGKTPAQLWAERKAGKTDGQGSFAGSHVDEPVNSYSEPFNKEEEDVDVPHHTSVSALRNQFAGAGFSKPSESSIPPPPPLNIREQDHEQEEQQDEVSETSAIPIPPPPPPAFEREKSPTPPPAPPILPTREEAPAPAAAAAAATAPPPPPLVQQVPIILPESESEPAQSGGKQAKVLYDYDKAEDNELSLVEDEILQNVDFVDEGWWEATNARGERGLFPSNYVEVIEVEEPNTAGSSIPPPPPTLPSQETAPPPEAAEIPPPPPPPPAPIASESQGKTAKTLYDYTADEDNELTFPEDAIITNIEFTDEDWWSGEYNGQHGLFPSNYVELQG